MNICCTRLVTFLQTELALPPNAIALALRQVGAELHLVPVVLWQYGLVNLLELEQLWDWLHQAEPTPALTTSTLTTPALTPPALTLVKASTGTPAPAPIPASHLATAA